MENDAKDMAMTPREGVEQLRERMGEAIIGQREVIDRLLIGLLANGNLLVEGLPGQAKTRAIKALAKNLDCDFSRIQFTPDLLPSDVTCTEVYHQGAKIRFEPGPIFANIVLADEINRAPPMVRAALLKAMKQRQVTVAGTRTWFVDRRGFGQCGGIEVEAREYPFRLTAKKL